MSPKTLVRLLLEHRDMRLGLARGDGERAGAAQSHEIGLRGCQMQTLPARVRKPVLHFQGLSAEPVRLLKDQKWMGAELRGQARFYSTRAWRVTRMAEMPHVCGVSVSM
jgi:hypothetical protein